MRNIIVYASKYGSTRRYAEELSRRTNIEMIEHKGLKKVKEYDNIIYFGGVYINSCMGVKRLRKATGNVIVAPVCLGDVSIDVVREDINESVRKAVGKKVASTMHIVNLRGAIDYNMLEPVDYMGMKMMYKMLSKEKEEKLTDGGRMILETFGKRVDFVDFSRLDEIEALIEK